MVSSGRIVRINKPAAGGWLEYWEVPSHSSPTSAHVVSMHRKGYWGCDCWPWRKSREDCKHIKDLKTFRHAHEADLAAVTVDKPLIIAQEKFDRITNQLKNFEF